MSRISHDSSSQGHVSPDHVDQEEVPAAAYDCVPLLADSFPREPSDTFLLIYYRDHVVRQVWDE